MVGLKQLIRAFTLAAGLTLSLNSAKEPPRLPEEIAIKRQDLETESPISTIDDTIAITHGYANNGLRYVVQNATPDFSFSPDADQLASIVKNSSSNESELFILDMDQNNVTTFPSIQEVVRDIRMSDQALSELGDLTFTAVDAVTGKQNIYLLIQPGNFNTSLLEGFTYPSIDISQPPKISPNGQHILFGYEIRSREMLAVYDTSSQNISPISTLQGHAFGGDLSNELVVFQKSWDDGDFHVGRYVLSSGTYKPDINPTDGEESNFELTLEGGVPILYASIFSTKHGHGISRISPTDASYRNTFEYSTPFMDVAPDANGKAFVTDGTKTGFFSDGVFHEGGPGYKIPSGQWSIVGSDGVIGIHQENQTTRNSSLFIFKTTP